MLASVVNHGLRPSYVFSSGFKAGLKRLARRMLLPIFSRLNPGDITISHHYTGPPFLSPLVFIPNIRATGTWGSAPGGAMTMMVLQSLLEPGQTALDVGGHIGYLSLLMAAPVGPSSSVHVLRAISGKQKVPGAEHAQEEECESSSGGARGRPGEKDALR